jgi:hypothetical protein
MNYRNSEGYASPTEHEALTRIRHEELKEERQKKYRPIVYICSPFSQGDKKQNVINARRFCKYAVAQNCIPFAPHLFFPQFMNDENPKERDMAFKMNHIMLGNCDELWVFGNKYTIGMQCEMKWAMRKKVHIRFFDENGKEKS